MFGSLFCRFGFYRFGSSSFLTTQALVPGRLLLRPRGFGGVPRNDSLGLHDLFRFRDRRFFGFGRRFFRFLRFFRSLGGLALLGLGGSFLGGLPAPAREDPAAPTTGRALLAILLPIIVCCGGGFVLAVMGGILGGFAGHH